ncbi:hypothetical protein [Solidesulfovibrio magneticus]|uniref:Uncharacterized protein n=1 Tax=Solidesulfovibrio magneticus (strain ATCC 700980 / DSM 13731 / RS-1) TaxID=573370 RepID=C4XMB8_SOLM1|nr:hypothetical protein [Solidesulfovibrio magneticus]BAH77246.1 hypothetical protein DMR_37550 [Solidesulfovibrio magneticus RS-1]
MDADWDKTASSGAPRVDALDKACSRERYAADETPPDGWLAEARRAGQAPVDLGPGEDPMPPAGP